MPCICVLLKILKARKLNPALRNISAFCMEKSPNIWRNILKRKAMTLKNRGYLLRTIQEIHRQMVHPLKVVTPFQILKYCYGVKGFEMGFAELAGAMLIFDEIHAYDSQTFAQIASSLKWLHQYLQIRVLVMTATLPSFMLRELQEALGNFKVVKADDNCWKHFTRHQVQIKEGDCFRPGSRSGGFLNKRRKNYCCLQYCRQCPADIPSASGYGRSRKSRSAPFPIYC